jgi:hypothetical protein
MPKAPLSAMIFTAKLRNEGVFELKFITYQEDDVPWRLHLGCVAMHYEAF